MDNLEARAGRFQRSTLPARLLSFTVIVRPCLRDPVTADIYRPVCTADKGHVY